ncbi:MAG TPA: VCBS repeat-containing protein, partial [bacterium]|nr:VCBS repeat-containing protein [bacterium]
MKKNISLFTIFLCVIALVASFRPLFAIDKALSSDAGVLSYAWVSDRMDVMPWGLEVGDLDGDKDEEIILLYRDFLEIGHFKDGAFVRSASCNFKNGAKGARLDLFDIDGDGDYEAVVTAITIGKPTAMLIDYDSAGCRVVKSEIPWSFRAISGGEQDGLYGQWWSGQKYFSGPVYSIEISKKIKKRDKLLLPRFASLYDFLILPEMGEEHFVLLQKSYSPLEIMRREERSFKRFWKSSEKFGG